MEWLGTVPNWLAAIAAVGALTTTVIVILRDRRDRVEYQARRLSLWSELDRTLADDRERDYCVYVRNSSDSPVFDGLVKVGSNDSLYFAVHVVPAHETVDYRLNSKHFPADLEPPEVEITFRDAARRFWRIGTDGILHHASPHHRQVLS